MSLNEINCYSTVIQKECLQYFTVSKVTFKVLLYRSCDQIKRTVNLNFGQTKLIKVYSPTTFLVILKNQIRSSLFGHLNNPQNLLRIITFWPKVATMLMCKLFTLVILASFCTCQFFQKTTFANYHDVNIRFINL